MSFKQGVLQPIFSPSKALATDLGICMEVIGDGDDADLPGVTVSPKGSSYQIGENGVWGATNKNPKIRVTLLNQMMKTRVAQRKRPALG